MTEIYIALGSNLGDKRSNLENAITKLSVKMKVLQVSRFYETEAVGMETGHSHPFMNAVIRCETELPPEEMMQFLLQTEADSGRIRNSEAGHFSRVIDLDLLVFGNLIVNQTDLVIPHPRIQERLFVLKPLMDLNAELEIPGTGRKVKEFYRDLLLTENG